MYLSLFDGSGENDLRRKRKKNTYISKKFTSSNYTLSDVGKEDVFFQKVLSMSPFQSVLFCGLNMGESKFV